MERMRTKDVTVPRTKRVEISYPRKNGQGYGKTTWPMGRFDFVVHDEIELRKIGAGQYIVPRYLGTIMKSDNILFLAEEVGNIWV
jgi:hypothetical protein